MESETSNAPKRADAPEPIPLRDLIVLLNYERMISDPKFEGSKLLESSLAVGTTVFKYMNNYPLIFWNDPRSIQERHVHIFSYAPDAVKPEHPSTLVEVHPAATPAVHQLGFAEREAIFLESRGYGGSVHAIGLFQAFFDLCPPEQEISVQMRNETPVIIPTTNRFYITWSIHKPKLRTFCVIPHKPTTLGSGSLLDDLHCSMGFWCPGTPHAAVFVDMGRMHYSNKPGGLYGENYFMGTHQELYESLKGGGKSISAPDRFKWRGERIKTTGSKLEVRLKGCAERVWARWQNREKEGWCQQCGKGGPDLIDCPGCPVGKIQYCAVEHMQKHWELHSFTCSGKQFGGD